MQVTQRVLAVPPRGQADRRRSATCQKSHIISQKPSGLGCGRAEASGSAIPEADKVAVRDNLLEGIVRAPPLVRAQLGECLKTVVYSDFPDRWPGILHAIQQQLATQARSQGARRGAEDAVDPVVQMCDKAKE